MSTGLEYTNFISKRVLGTADFKERFLEYLLQRVMESNREQYSSAFFHPKGVVMAGDGANSFEVVESPPGNTAVASDGYGNFLEYWNSLSAGIKFENLNTVVYYVGLKYCLFPEGIQINPDHGQPEYVAFRDEIGESANPNSVTDNGDGTIDFRVDSVLETGVDNTGRTVSVYKTIPALGAINESIAIEHCVVFYSGGQNYIQTTGNLGQGTINTDEDVYTVVCIGPTVKRYTDLRTEAGYCYVGYITGNAGTPSSFNYDDQKVIDHNWTDILIYGLDQDFWPKVDATYKLGRSTHQWSEIHTVDFLMSGDFLPTVHNTQDIGATGMRWADGWFGGKLECNDLAVQGEPPGEGVFSHLAPEQHNTYDLGDKDYYWSSVYGVYGTFDNLAIIDTGGSAVGVDSGLIPATDDQHDLGNSTWRWDSLTTRLANIEELTVSIGVGFGCASNLFPKTDRSYDLGSSSYLWDDLHVGVVYIDNRLELTYGDVSPQPGLNSKLDPTFDNTFALGLPSYQWSNIATKTITISSTAPGGVTDDLNPFTNDSLDFGSVSYTWDRAYINTIYLASGAGGPNGIDSNCAPGQNDTWDLGLSTYRWDSSVIRTLDLRILDLDGGSSGIGCISDFIPGALDLTLGDSSYNWDILYLGVANIDKLVLDTTGGTGFGVGSDVLPEADNTYDLGSSFYPWDDLWVAGIANIDKLVLDTTGGTGYGVGSDVLPEDTDTYALGTSNYRWDTLHVKEITLGTGTDQGFASSIYPTSDLSSSIGRAANRWFQGFIQRINLGVGAGDGFLTNVRPSADDTYNLGHADYRWSELFLRQLNLSDADTSNDGFTGTTFKPSTHGDIYMGKTLYKWGGAEIEILDCDQLTVSNTAANGCSDLVPVGVANRDLGNDVYYWDELYCDHMYYKTTAPTAFDDIDDLALIDLYIPTEKRITIEKKGVKRSVRLADKNSIPWPMLGPKDPTVGDYFIHAGDSITFLLGALKQLHGEHRKAIQRIQCLEAATLPV